ncbi:unnamed protein product [Victoria cruziana]
MAAMVARGSQLPPTGSVQEKGSRNKRKFRADPPLASCSDCDPNANHSIGNPSNCPSPMAEFPGYEIPDRRNMYESCPVKENCCNFCGFGQQQIDIGKPSSQAHRTRSGLVYNEFLQTQDPQDELETNEFQDADWNELTESQLEELVLSNLDTIYRSAIKRIASCGYSEDVAKQAVLRYGRCYGCKDPVSNIVDNALAYLKNGREIDAKDQFFQDLPQLEKYILDEMVCVLREVRPFFSTGDAMWCLLICDMNVAHACAMDGDAMGNFGVDENLEGSSVSTIPQANRVASMNLPETSSLKPQLKDEFSLPSGMPVVGGIPNLPPAKFSLSSNVSSTVQNAESLCSLDRLSNETLSSSTFPISSKPPDEDAAAGSKISSFCLSRESSAISKEQLASKAQVSISDAKSASEAFRPESHKKHHLNNFKRVHFRQKSGQAESSHRGNVGKASSKVSKISRSGGAVLDRKWNPESVSSSTSLKGPVQSYTSIGLSPSQSSISTGKPPFSAHAGVPANGGFMQAGMNSPLSCSLTNTDLSLSLSSKGKDPVDPNQNVPDVEKEAGVCGCTPQSSYQIFGSNSLPDAKDEKLLRLVHHARDLQTQLQEWTEWAQQKVMQAARRLGKDKAELKTLRQEREEASRMIKERQTLEENTIKKLSEMEAAMARTSAQLGYASGATHRLELENVELRKEMEAAKVHAEEAAANCSEASRREKKTLTKISSCERQKELLQEELATERRKLSQLQHQVLKAKECLALLEDKWRHEEKAKEEALVQLNSEKEEKRQLEYTSKSKEDAIRMKAETDYQQYRDDIRRLESEIAQLRLNTDSSKIAALRWGVDHSYASRLTDNKGLPKLKDNSSHLARDIADFQDLSVGEVKRERECVMCLSEEMSVVFLPCAHQVVCTNCNELHEKQGMKDCPSCRAPIMQRISVRFADS